MTVHTTYCPTRSDAQAECACTLAVNGKGIRKVGGRHCGQPTPCPGSKCACGVEVQAEQVTGATEPGPGATSSTGGTTGTSGALIGPEIENAEVWSA